MIYKSYIGIDPGNSGGICVITDDHAEAYKTPGTVADMSDLINTITMNHDKPIAIIEAVHSMPGNSARSMFTFGSNYGMWLGLLAAYNIPYTQVTPAKWIRSYGSMPKAKTQRKNHLKHLAQQRYPDLKVTLATADAILLAHYCKDLQAINK